MGFFKCSSITTLPLSSVVIVSFVIVTGVLSLNVFEKEIFFLFFMIKDSIDQSTMSHSMGRY